MTQPRKRLAAKSVKTIVGIIGFVLVLVGVLILVLASR
jgi:hypothetical protein